VWAASARSSGGGGTELRRRRRGAWSSAVGFDSSGLVEEAKSVEKELGVGVRCSCSVNRATWGRVTGCGAWAEEAWCVAERLRVRERRYAAESSERMGSSCECFLFGSHRNHNG
jgi:hypothetical protein